MSGSHFNDNKYVYYYVYRFADELENDIANNNKENDGWCPDFSDATIAFLKSKIEEIRKTAKLMKEIDYLYSGDHGEDSFMKAVKESK